MDRSQTELPAEDLLRLRSFATALIDQHQARTIIRPYENSPGFWFGGGNLSQGPDGHLYLVGRYRNAGDSRTGIGKGNRGLELAIFQSTDAGTSFQKLLSYDKRQLDLGDHQVLSIEGSSLAFYENQVELLVSTEKRGIDYPDEFKSFLKPGTGVWTIDRATAPTVEGLAHAGLVPFIASCEPATIHVKDPFVYRSPTRPQDAGSSTILFCTHPFCWSSSNTAFITREMLADSQPPNSDFFPRGKSWDVAMTRGTCVLDIPRVGPFADREVSLMFYDGGESLRDMEQHDSGVHRPRGYSCEELGGLAYFVDGDLRTIQRISTYLPMFVSPFGTACSRYVDILATYDGFHATWQQSQSDRSQPLVHHFLGRDQANAILT